MVQSGADDWCQSLELDEQHVLAIHCYDTQHREPSDPLLNHCFCHKFHFRRKSYLHSQGKCLNTRTPYIPLYLFCYSRLESVELCAAWAATWLSFLEWRRKSSTCFVSPSRDSSSWVEEGGLLDCGQHQVCERRENKMPLKTNSLVGPKN